MLKNFISLFLLLIIFEAANAQLKIPSKQEVLDKFGFEEHLIISDFDTVACYIHRKIGSTPGNLVLYLQGSTPDPLFKIEKNKGEFLSYRWFPGDYKFLDSSYCYAVIAKTGIPALHNEKGQDIEKYHKMNTLDHRVSQADRVVKYLIGNIIENPKNVIVYGHSEGSAVAAKLATINKEITHLGFWSGNVLPDYYDFILFNSKASWTKKITKEEAYQNIEKIITSFREIALNPEDTNAESLHDYSNKRWWSYAEPPLYHLQKLDIPIFVQVAANDESAPIESSFLLPLEFIRLGKNNLTYEICLECDHGFEIIKENGEKEDMWDAIFSKFMKWVSEN